MPDILRKRFVKACCIAGGNQATYPIDRARFEVAFHVFISIASLFEGSNANEYHEGSLRLPARRSQIFSLKNMTEIMREIQRETQHKIQKMHQELQTMSVILKRVTTRLFATVKAGVISDADSVLPKSYGFCPMQ